MISSLSRGSVRVSNKRNRFSSIFPLCIFLITVVVLAGCNQDDGPPPLKEQNFDPEEIASFVEPDFPFITTSVDARKLGASFPTDNITPRCLAIKLGSEAYTCFDTDMLRWSVAWTGDFLPMVTMAQISYRDFHNKSNQIPHIAGDPKIATGLYPGWMKSEPQFSDPRPPSPNPEAPSWGPLPQEVGRWNGVYLDGEEVVLSYSAYGTDILEKPGVVTSDGEKAFTRTFEVEDLQESLSLAIAEVSDGVRSEISEEKAVIYHGEDESLVTIIGLIKGNSDVNLKVSDDRYATASLSPDTEANNFRLVMWQGSAENQEGFNNLLSNAKSTLEIPDVQNGGPAQWTETVRTQGQVAPDTAAYVVDKLTLPIPNPWKRNVRVVDVDFFEDNQAAVVTFEGDVWLVDGINEDLSALQWQRYASGMYGTQSLEVVRDTVYVYGKEGIVKLHDLNDDGSADYYENFSNLMGQSIETREWASDMVVSPDGSFYVAKFGALDMGPETETSSPNNIMGFRAGSRYGGSIVKISPDGRNIDYHATGFRGPYLGINPETGVLSASDQQGHYMPSTPILLVDQGDYYGVPATAHRDPLPEVTPPLTWIPHGVDRSGAGQVWVTGDEMGPLSGNMVHLSYGQPGLFKVLIDSTSDEVQGGVSFIPANYPAPTQKGTIGPEDGQLYVGGFSLWGSDSDIISSLIRLRYTGEESLMPQNFKVREGGVLIEFDVELDEEVATNAANFQVKRWNYKRTEQYGSGHFKLDGSPGEEMLPVFSTHLSEDKKAVFIAVPDIQKVMQMEVSYNLASVDGISMEDQLWFTVNDVEKAEFLASQFDGLNVEEILSQGDSEQLAQEVEEPITVARGEKLFQETGCIACHSISDVSKGEFGPPLKDVFGATRNFEDSEPTVADEDYIKESIVEPNQKIVEGYEPEMPSFLGILSDREISSITLYLKSLTDAEETLSLEQ